MFDHNERAAMLWDATLGTYRQEPSMVLIRKHSIKKQEADDHDIEGTSAGTRTPIDAGSVVGDLTVDDSIRNF